MRFGIGGDCPLTLQEVGLYFNVSPVRIKHIEAKALRSLRYSNRSRRLKDYLENV